VDAVWAGVAVREDSPHQTFPYLYLLNIGRLWGSVGFLSRGEYTDGGRPPEDRRAVWREQ